MQIVNLAVGLVLPLMAAAVPTAKGNSYYQIVGYHLAGGDAQTISQVEGKPMVPYRGNFWFGLSIDHLCDAPQPGNGTSFSCNKDIYTPLYTVPKSVTDQGLDSKFKLATTHVPAEITIGSSGQLTYDYYPDTGGWSFENDIAPTDILYFGGDGIFYICQKQQRDGSSAWQVWHDSKDSGSGNCIGLNLKSIPSNVTSSALPYRYGYDGE